MAKTYFNLYKNIYFTSDLHLGDSGLCLGTTDWTDQTPCRNFKSVEEMDLSIISNINKTVPRKGILFLIGDFVIGDYYKLAEYRKKINCEEIYFIIGNHDPDRELTHDIQMKIPENSLVYDKEYLGNNQIFPHTLFETIGHYKEVRFDEQLICMGHYAHRIWHDSHKGSIFLHAHDHGSLEEYQEMEKIYVVDSVEEIEVPDTHQYAQFKTSQSLVYKPTGKLYKTMDIGIDTHPEFRPYSYDEIIRIMEHRIPTNVDQHKPFGIYSNTQIIAPNYDRIKPDVIKYL